MMKKLSRSEPQGLVWMNIRPLKPRTCGGMMLSRMSRIITANGLPGYFATMLTVVLERNVPDQPYLATDQANHGASTQAPAAAEIAVVRAKPPSQRLPNPIAIHAAAITTT